MPPVPRWRSILRVAGPAALAIAAVIFLVVRLTGTGGDRPLPLPPAPGAIPAQGNQAWLTPEVREVANKFILTAGLRHNTGASWELLDSTFVGKAEYTKREWAKGNIPVQQATFPISKLKKVALSVAPSTPKALTLEVLMIPKEGKAEQFEIGLRQRGSGTDKRWLVDYWMTGYSAGFRDNPK